MLEQYVKEILSVARQGDAREESYYSTLENLIKEYAVSKKKKDIHITSQPKKTDAGNPDFRVWEGKYNIVGYIEAKLPDSERELKDYEESEQLKRYKSIFPNMILTNFFEFRLYRNGTFVDKVEIADPKIINTLKGKPHIKNEIEFDKIMNAFFSFSFPNIVSAQPLALELANRTRFLRDEVIAEEIKEEEQNGMGKILGFYEAFQTYLIRGLTKEYFADIYAQTITYGLFASRLRNEGKFDRKVAIYDIPKNIGILRDIFEFISLGDLPPQLEWIVDDISHVLANVDVQKIFSEFYNNQKGEDPIFHFYETFLDKYDPEERNKMGVFYTPEPVVKFIINSLHLLLKEKYNLIEGVANEKVTILDPAGGTLTFIAETIKKAISEFTTKYGEGGKEEFIKENILKNYYAFELMIAPYTVGHLKISYLLEELGYKLKEDERIKLFITNTLELEDIEQTSLPGMASLSSESIMAGEVKKEIPILVVLGNPPYKGASTSKSSHGTNANEGKWISRLVDDYKYIDGQSIGEKNPRGLQDDYVKFIRFAEWKLENMGEGILGFITAHNYLDAITCRGMRWHLMESFNEIYIIDLHGDSPIRKGKKGPDIEKDENVFDIQTGVSISFFIRKGSGQKQGCKVFYYEIKGLRGNKFEWLLSNDIKTINLEEIRPHPPNYFFVPKKEKYKDIYDTFWQVTDIFPLHSVGIAMGRHKLTVQFTPEKMWFTIKDFSSLSEERAREKYNLGEDATDWKVSLAQKDLIGSNLRKEFIKPILYRPFDIRYTYYTGHSGGFICRPRSKLMPHLFNNNLALITTRFTKGEKFKHALVSQNISDIILISSKTSNSAYVFPLYLYQKNGKRTNINEMLIKSLSEVYGNKPSPEEIFNYIYAILYAEIYRGKYMEELGTDYPKIPFTTDYELFIKVGEFGKELVDFHLLRSSELDFPISKFEGHGDNDIIKINYIEKEERLYINKTQYFDGVKKTVWQYKIGSYEVISKWLKERKKEKMNLSLEDIKHLCKVITAIEKTIEIQGEIDKLYPDVEKEMIKSIEKPIIKLSNYTD